MSPPIEEKKEIFCQQLVEQQVQRKEERRKMSASVWGVRETPAKQLAHPCLGATEEARTRSKCPECHLVPLEQCSDTQILRETTQIHSYAEILGYGYEPQRIQIHEWIPARPKATKRIVLGYPCHAHRQMQIHTLAHTHTHRDCGAQRGGKWPFTVVAVEQLLPQQNTRRLRSGSDFLAATLPAHSPSLFLSLPSLSISLLPTLNARQRVQQDMLSYRQQAIAREWKCAGDYNHFKWDSHVQLMK